MSTARQPDFNVKLSEPVTNHGTQERQSAGGTTRWLPAQLQTIPMSPLEATIDLRQRPFDRKVPSPLKIVRTDDPYSFVKQITRENLKELLGKFKMDRHRPLVR